MGKDKRKIVTAVGRELLGCDRAIREGHNETIFAIDFRCHYRNIGFHGHRISPT